MSDAGRRDAGPAAARALWFPWISLRRWGFFGAVALTGALGIVSMFGILAGDGLSGIEVGMLGLFAPTFVWISLAFWNAVVGSVLHVLDRDPVTLERAAPAVTDAGGEPAGGGAGRAGRVALAVPVRDEDLAAVLDRVSRITASLEETGERDRFDVHLLSDTTAREGASAEDEVWSAFERSYRGAVPVSYRRREHNTGRKAGNVAEMCARVGHRYRYLVVLDADSVMSGRTLVALTRMMDANPRAGIIQTVPLPTGQETPFGRIVQFGAAVSSRLFAAGQAFWQGDAANYWGHNAILRMEPFMRHCRLPTIPGRPPLGGEILSHDFVEAALMRRAGWGVYLVPSLGGSWEGVPANLIDYALRDRRWAQGSLQHLRLLGLSGLHPLSRLHFALGAMGYVSSLLWLALLVAGTVYVMDQPDVGSATGNGTVSGPPWISGAGLPSLLAVTAALLFVPKLLGVGVGLRRAREFGGRSRFLLGCLAEAGFSVLIAPILMMFHTRAVLEIVAGRSVPWASQVRETRRVTDREASGAAGWILLVGAGWAGATLGASPMFFAWMTPIFTGLLLVLPVVRWSGRAARSVAGAGTATRWLTVPSEHDAPPELRRGGPPRLATGPTRGEKPGSERRSLPSADPSAPGSESLSTV